MDNWKPGSIRKVLLLIILFAYNYCYCQDGYLSIKARVLDKHSHASLQFASVGVKGAPLGTLTNAQGEFELFVPSSLADDSLLISYIGYKNFTTRISSFTTEQVIELQEEPIQLAEVVVHDKEFSAREIVKKALENIEQNYQTDPFMLKGFYRSTTRVNDDYVSVLEAALKVHDPGYKDTHQKGDAIVEKVEVEAIRKTPVKIYKDLPWLNHSNMLKAMLAINNVKYRNVVFNGKAHWKYALDTITHYNNKPVYVIKSGTSWTFKLYIDTETFAVYKVAVDVRSYPDWHSQRLSDTVLRKTIHFVKTVEFKEYNHKLYLNYINYQEEFEYTHPGSKKVLYTTRYHQDFSVNDVVINSPPQPEPTKILDNNVSLEKQATTYDPSFWKHYNIIKELHVNEKLPWQTN
jgi:hypothetical protein